jgi:tRNA(Ile)-lysidine synthase
MAFEASELLPLLRRLPPAQRYLVAYSGGCDSTVLLHALCSLRERLATPVLAIHVDHGLQADATQWARRCAEQCAEWQIPLQVLKVNAQPQPGESREAAARHARYQALRAVVQTGDVLLTAHHREDQAETFLLQLLRGAGPRGLAAMPVCTRFGPAHLARPLLHFPRRELCDYAQRADLHWIDDPSNFDTGFDRNFLRHDILPPLLTRWPAAAQVIVRASEHQAEAAQLLDELAAEDGQRLGSDQGLSVTGLRALSQARARNLIRHWIRVRGLAVPDAARLQRILDEVVNARADATPQVSWQGAEARRYRDTLFVFPPLPAVPENALPWNGQAPLAVSGLGTLTAGAVAGGLSNGLQGKALVVRFGATGERCRPVGRRHHQRLKKLWQDAGVPPWVRERTPLLYVDGQLAAVAGRWICADFAAPAGEMGWMPLWQPFGIETKGENNDNLSGPAP